MQIIGGQARNIVLDVPPGLEVRPTAGRARKALFDSLGARLSGSSIFDLCAGSGALALEAASRGAASALLVESDPRHARVIEGNILKLERVGVRCDFHVRRSTLENTAAWLKDAPVPELVFADPPYAVSAELFAKLLGDELFRKHAAGALVVWEIPDAPGSIGEFLRCPPLDNQQIRRLGGTDFLWGEVSK